MNVRETLYVLHRDEPSETFIRREIESLRGLGLPVAVHTLAAPPAADVPPSARRAVLRALAARLLVPPRSAAHALRLIRNAPHAWRLAAAAARLGRPLLHAQFAWTAADAASLAAAALGLPWTCAVHAWDVFTRPPRETRARLATAAGVAACSGRAAAALLAAGLPAERVRLIRHGLDPAAFPFNPQRPAGHIAAVGRLVPKKGFDTLLAACAGLRRGGVEVHCTLAGDGPEGARLRRLAETLGIADAVTWTGWLPAADAQRVIAGATVLAHPSRRLADADADGFANVLTEAMFLGTPVVTTAAGAAAELLRDGVSACIVPPEDPAALTAALAELLADPGLRHRLAAAARTTAEADLDQNRLVRKLADFLDAAREPVISDP